MILPICVYGNPVLRKQCIPIEKNYPGLAELIRNMWETMYNAHGVGLAAPQIGLPIRLFIVDSEQMEDESKDFKGIKRVMINAEMIEESGEDFVYEEGCLSIPSITGNVTRLDHIRIKYLNENFEEVEEELIGMNARVVQHEYDHIEGKLFTELLKPVKRKLLQKKLEAMKKGRVKADYPLKVLN